MAERKEIRIGRKHAEKPERAGQARPVDKRFRLQVDRLTKTSFDILEEAEKARSLIKKAYSAVHASVYDAEEHVTKIIGAS